jgi:hypothetical protein
MPSDVALIPIFAALKTLMVAHAPLTALIGTKTVGAGGGPAVYDDGAVTQNTPPPYVTIGAGTQIPFHTMGPIGSARYGWNCTLQIKAVSTGTDAEVLGIMSAVMGLLYDGRELTLAGYGNAWCDEFSIQPMLVSTVAGVTTREVPGILRVYAVD